MLFDAGRRAYQGTMPLLRTAVLLQDLKLFSSKAMLSGTACSLHRLQNGVFRLGLTEDRHVRVGVLP